MPTYAGDAAGDAAGEAAETPGVRGNEDGAEAESEGVEYGAGVKVEDGGYDGLEHGRNGPAGMESGQIVREQFLVEPIDGVAPEDVDDAEDAEESDDDKEGVGSDESEYTDVPPNIAPMGCARTVHGATGTAMARLLHSSSPVNARIRKCVMACFPLGKYRWSLSKSPTQE